jgi:O-antigen/teichoic acid export membrane protein
VGRAEWRAFRELLFFGGGLTVARIANNLALQGDNLVVGRWLGPAALGLYGRAYQLMSVPAVLLGQALDTVLFPTMARVQDEPPRLRAAYGRAVALVALVACPASAVLVATAPALLAVALGPRWSEVTLPFQVLALGLLFRTSYKLSDSLARATGAVYRRAWRQGVYAALVVGGSWIGQRWGITGVAVGVLGALLVNFLLMAQLSTALTGMSWRAFGAAHVPAARLAAVAGGAAWACTELSSHWGAPALASLLAAGGIALAAVALCARFGARLFLGADGAWMFDTLRSLRPTSVARPVTPAVR